MASSVLFAHHSPFVRGSRAQMGIGHPLGSSKIQKIHTYPVSRPKTSWLWIPILSIPFVDSFGCRLRDSYWASIQRTKSNSNPSGQYPHLQANPLKTRFLPCNFRFCKLVRLAGVFQHRSKARLSELHKALAIIIARTLAS